MNSTLLFLLWWTIAIFTLSDFLFVRSSACIFKQSVGNREEYFTKEGEPWAMNKSLRNVRDDCYCGFDKANRWEPLEPKYAENNEQKTWHFYIHVINPTLMRTCTGTMINSKMILTSHNCLKLKPGPIPPYEAWRPPPTNKSPSTLAEPENLVVSRLAEFAKIDKPKEKYAVEKIIYNGDFFYSDSPKPGAVPNDDVAIVVLKGNWPIKALPPVCLPETKIDPTGYFGYYYGVGGNMVQDPTPESRFVGNIMIMPGKICDWSDKSNSLCTQYRVYPPTSSGGPLLLPQNGQVNIRGFTPNQTVFLVGLASYAQKRRPSTSITTTYFSNILSLIPYLEYYSNDVNATWCQTPEFDLGKRKNPKQGILKKYEWEGKVPGPRPESLNCVCGIAHGNKSDGRAAQARIVGGEEAIPYEFPWIALYNSEWEGVEGKAACGSTIINDRVILTAAHCIVFPPNQVLFGDEASMPKTITIAYGIHALENDTKQKYAVVDKVIVHNDFLNANLQGTVGDGDIALILLKEPLEFSTAQTVFEAKLGDIRPPCLPRYGEAFEIIGKQAMLAGWGFTPPDENSQHPSQWEIAKTLQKLEVTIHPLDQCSMRVPNSLRDSVFCAGYFNRSKQSSRGDSGGPISVQSDKEYWMQVGLVSFEQDVFDFEEIYVDPVLNQPAPRYKESVMLYTNIQRYIDFIDYYSEKVGAKWCKSHV